MSEAKVNEDPPIQEKRFSQWEQILRKFSEAHKVQCKVTPLEMPRVRRSAKNFPTGSQYEGTWDVLGMSGQGVYTFTNGVVYDGEFEDGMFHGEGQLQYPGGIVLLGKWHKGEMVERKLIFADGLEYSEHDWQYCKMPDRRFTVEYDRGLQPAGRSYLTADQPTRAIPPGYYDTGDGFYDPKTKAVYKADDITAIVRTPSNREQNWIIENCRTNPEVSLGPRPGLFEEWTEPQLEYEPVPVTASQKVHTTFMSQVLDQDEEMCRKRSSSGCQHSRIPFHYDPKPEPSNSEAADAKAKNKMSFVPRRCLQPMFFL